MNNADMNHSSRKQDDLEANSEPHPGPNSSANREQNLDQTPSANTGPNLMVAYLLVVLALLAAIGIAVMIVYPFYLRR